MHGASAAASSRHRNVAPGSLAENVNAASVAAVTGSGAASIVVCTGALDGPRAHECSAGVSSTFPEASMARTRNVWAPTVTPVRVVGLVHGA